MLLLQTRRPLFSFLFFFKRKISFKFIESGLWMQLSLGGSFTEIAVELNQNAG